MDMSWSSHLICWRRPSPITVSKIDNGITFTEFYYIMEFQGNSSDVRDWFVNIVKGRQTTDYICV